MLTGLSSLQRVAGSATREPASCRHVPRSLGVLDPQIPRAGPGPGSGGGKGPFRPVSQPFCVPCHVHRHKRLFVAEMLSLRREHPPGRCARI